MNFEVHEWLFSPENVSFPPQTHGINFTVLFESLFVWIMNKPNVNSYFLIPCIQRFIKIDSSISSLFSRSDGSEENRNAKWMQFFFTTVTSWKQRRFLHFSSNYDISFNF